MRITNNKVIWKRTRGLAVGILLTALLVLVKDEYARLLVAHANYGMQALITRQEECDLDSSKGVNLFIGSSMFRKGLDIDALDDGLDGDNYILSYNGTRPFQCYEEIQYAINKGVKIRHLYVDLYAYALTVDPWVEDSRLFLETDLEFKITIWNEMKKYSENPLKDFWELFVTANNERLLCWPVDYALTNSEFRNGGSLSPDAGYAESDLEAGEYEVPETVDVVINKDQIAYLQKLIALCEKEEIPITFIETPKYKSIMYNAEYVSLMRAYLQVLNEAGCEYFLVEDSALTCQNQISDTLLKDSIPYDTNQATCYSDTIHLSGEGKKSFTKALVRCLME